MPPYIALDRFNFPGTYALLLYLPARTPLKAGGLEPHAFVRGWYLYVGSAQGPGGVAARIGHHLRSHHPPRWHLDYLRPWSRPRGAWAGPCAREHQWAALLGRLPGAQFPVVGFGSSDCRCPAHLIFLPRRPAPVAVARFIFQAFPHDPRPIVITLD